MPFQSYTCPPDGAWHCIGENITSIIASNVVDIDIREDGTGWVRNPARFPIPVEYLQAKEPNNA